jgi:peroxiredoxin family protein
MNKKLSLLLFSGDYDKALVALILANTAAEANMDVSIFFAFWGLFILRTPGKTAEDDNKSAMEKMFSAVTPKGPQELPLSKMNFSGLGKKMLEAMMADDETPTLENFLNGAIKKGIKFYGCKLSIDIMGFKKEELIPQLEIIEAKDYLNEAVSSDIQLFI